MIFRQGDNETKEHNDPSLANISEKDDFIFPDSGFFSHIIRNDKFEDVSIPDFNTVIDFNNKEITLNYTGDPLSFGFNEKIIMPNLLLKEESKGILWVKTDVSTPFDISPIYSILLGWTTGNDSKMGGYDISIARVGVNADGKYPFHEEALYCTKASLFRFVTDRTSSTWYILTRLSGDDITLTRTQV